PASTLPAVMGARLIREAGSELLPFSAFGGYLMSARALAVQHIWGPRAMASLIVDVTLEVATQILFAVVALALLAWYDLRSPIIGPVAVGLAVACSTTSMESTRRLGACKPASCSILHAGSQARRKSGSCSSSWAKTSTSRPFW